MSPELDKDGKYNNKADIFALGCIMYELVTNGEKAFIDGYAAFGYSTGGSKISLPLSFSHRWKDVWQGYLDRMLAIEAADRPSSHELQQDFEVYRSISLAEACLEERALDEALEIYETVKNTVKATEARLDSMSLKNMKTAYKRRPQIVTSAGLHGSAAKTYLSLQNGR